MIIRGENATMNKKDIINFFEREEIENAPCPLTNELVTGGYRQKSGGYIETAKKEGVENSTQYWHLIKCWAKKSKEDDEFNRRIQCGELIFCMAEVSEAVEIEKLEELKKCILGKYLNNRRKGNRKIQEACFDQIVNKVTKDSKSKS